MMTFNRHFQIGSRLLSQEAPCFIIAEAGVNHNGNMDLAYKMIDEAIDCGVDAIKFQAFKTEELILQSVEKASYQKRTTGESDSQFSMLKSLELSKNQYGELKAYCDKKGILFLITPFDEASLEELNDLQLMAYKISSTDLTNLPFLKKIARKNKPLILSTGMSYLEEVELALQTIAPLNQNVVLLHCTANYPVQDSEVNLNILNTFKERFNMLIGYSDHTQGVGASPYSLLYGAKVLEKHFTLDKTMSGPDHEASLDIPELKTYVQEIRRVERLMGSSIKRPQLSEMNTRRSLQKSLVAATAIKRGDRFSPETLIAKRCGGEGISPIHVEMVYNQFASRDFDKDEIISL